MNKTGLLILAAGGSRRMGRPKLIETFKGITLIERILNEVKDLQVQDKVVVLGGHREVYEPMVNNGDFRIVENKEWNKGISSSIREGITYFKDQQTHIDSVMILLCDMILVNRKYLSGLLDKAIVGDKGILASNYGSTFGPPAIFDKKYFTELLELEGDNGAKSVMSNHMNDLELVSFPDGLIDIDTPDDLLNWNHGN